MIVLAIDPGSITAGFALLKKESKKINYVSSGVLRFNPKVEFMERINDIYNQTQDLVEKFKPDAIALESLIFVKSPTALMKLAQSRGVMLAALSQNYHQRIYEYSPNLIKSTVTGHGHADKQGIQKFILQYFGIKEFKSHDESDALAIALCHLLMSGDKLYPEKSFLKPQKKKSGLAGALAHKIKESLP